MVKKLLVVSYEKELQKLNFPPDDKTLAKKKDLDYFGGKNYFDGDDGAQNYLVFQAKKIFPRTAFCKHWYFYCL